jgi:hypothetical protein
VLLIQLLVARVKRGRRRYKGPEAPLKLTKPEFKVQSASKIKLLVLASKHSTDWPTSSGEHHESISLLNETTN